MFLKLMIMSMKFLKNFKKKENKKNLIVFIDEMKESPYDHDLYWGFAYSFILDSEEYWKNIDFF